MCTDVYVVCVSNTCVRYVVWCVHVRVCKCMVSVVWCVCFVCVLCECGMCV